nr:MAG TPA: hypothetical protein [Bacteriophage sp.]DAT50647.1 MAG TPA: hypothetical protein [Bacteriophage sp.]DAX07156.1 MAG TPA: hypothetical protein [Bacteriophage sp.]
MYAFIFSYVRTSKKYHTEKTPTRVHPISPFQTFNQSTKTHLFVFQNNLNKNPNHIK